MKNYAKFALIVLLTLAGCSSREDSPLSVDGDTPVRYVICGVGDTNCFVSVRFKDFDSCESHKRWSGMLCDSRSVPGRMVCTADTGPQFSVAYCTK